MDRRFADLFEGLAGTDTIQEFPPEGNERGLVSNLGHPHDSMPIVLCDRDVPHGPSATQIESLVDGQDRGEFATKQEISAEFRLQ